MLATIVVNSRAEIEGIKTIESLTPQMVIETFAIHSSIPIIQTNVLQTNVVQQTKHDGNFEDATKGDTIPFIEKNPCPTQENSQT